MKQSRLLLMFCGIALVASAILVAARVASARQSADKLVYADFETVKDNRIVSNGGGLIQLFSYQENPSLQTRFKGLEGANPPMPEPVHLKQGDPNRAVAFDYELPAPNQYAGAGVMIYAQADKDGKPVSMDVSGYKYLTLQLYVTGVENVRLEFASRGQGINMSSGDPQTTFRVKPGLNTYQIPLKSLLQPQWAQVKVSTKDVLKKLTSVNVAVYCEQCKPTKGTVVIDNIVFQN